MGALKESSQNASSNLPGSSSTSVSCAHRIGLSIQDGVGGSGARVSARARRRGVSYSQRGGGTGGLEKIVMRVKVRGFSIFYMDRHFVIQNGANVKNGPI